MHVYAADSAAHAACDRKYSDAQLRLKDELDGINAKLPVRNDIGEHD